jgi:hypothetical protein
LSVATYHTKTRYMKKTVLACFVLTALVFGVSAQKTINDPNVIAVDAKGFQSIHVSNAFDVYITQGSEEAVAVSASETKYRDNIKVEVKNWVLKISYEKKKGFLSGLRSDKMNLKVYISVKNIEKLNVSGFCNVYFDGIIKAENLKLVLSGSSDIKGALDVKKLNANISGASHAWISGTASQLDVNASGASRFNGYGLNADFCNVSASGASKVQITVNKELSAIASGASDVLYKGEGVIRDVKASGAGKVSRGT